MPCVFQRNKAYTLHSPARATLYYVIFDVSYTAMSSLFLFNTVNCKFVISICNLDNSWYHHGLFLTSRRARWIHCIGFLRILFGGIQCNVFILPSVKSKNNTWWLSWKLRNVGKVVYIFISEKSNPRETHFLSAEWALHCIKTRNSRKLIHAKSNEKSLFTKFYPRQIYLLKGALARLPN